eukprot:12113896-Alexandrium_andersonii.AAC.1
MSPPLLCRGCGRPRAGSCGADSAWGILTNRALAWSWLSGSPGYFAQFEVRSQARDPMAPILRGASSRSGPWLCRACREVLATLR